MPSLDLVLSRVQMFQEQTKNLWDNTIRFRWSHDDYLKYRGEMMGKPEWLSLPRWAKENLRGYDSALYNQVYRLLDFGYMIDGKFVSIKSDKWYKNRDRYFERQRKGTLSFDSKTGHHVWKEDATKFWN